MRTIDHDLSFRSARKFEAFDEHVSRIEVSFTRIAVAVTDIVVTIA